MKNKKNEIQTSINKEFRFRKNKENKPKQNQLKWQKSDYNKP